MQHPPEKVDETEISREPRPIYDQFEIETGDDVYGGRSEKLDDESVVESSTRWSAWPVV